MIVRFRQAMLAATAVLLVTPTLGVRPAAADGAASTRNILFGAAAAAGTLLIINHNKKVHQRYADDARQEAALAEQRDNVQAAYESERRAYNNEVALVESYQHEVAIQHAQVVRDRAQVASLQHQLAYAGRSHQTVAAVARTQRVAVAPAPRVAPVAPQRVSTVVAAAPVEVSYGWGTL